MIIFILAIIVIMLFVIGISLLYKESAPSVNPKVLESLKADLAGAQSSQEKLKFEIDALKKESFQSKQALEEAQKGVQQVDVLKANENKYLQQIKDVEDQLARIYLKADEQAKGALEVINALRKDNESLKSQVAVQAAAVQQVSGQEELKKENEALKKQLEEIQLKVAQLQVDLSAATQDVDKGKESTGELERLNTENQKFQEANTQLTEQIKILTEQLKSTPQEQEELPQLKQVLEQLKGENKNLQKQLSDVQAAPPVPVAVPPEEVAKTKELQAACDDFKKQLDDMRQTVATLRDQNAQYEKSSGGQAEFEQRLGKLKEINDFLTRKEKFLQTELTKSRIKAVGLEKICEALKSQLESLTKVTPAG